MAGVVPASRGSNGRKQWNIRDKRSNRRLRSQLAEDGCPESQLVLAKQLLERKSDENVNDNEENARLGVFWLIKASEQGNMEATGLLQQCFQNGTGITEHNYLDVKACLSMPQNEKLAKRAAREMFVSLSSGRDFVTSEQLRRRMSKINLDKPPLILKGENGNQNVENNCFEAETMEGNATEEDESAWDEEFDYFEDNDDWDFKTENFGERLSQTHLEIAAADYSKGELPLVQSMFALTDPLNKEIESLNYLQRTLLHPLLTIEQSYFRFLSRFGSRFRPNLYLLFPSSSYIQFLTIFVLYPLFSFENCVIFLSTTVYYASFFVMVISTLQMLLAKKKFNNFRFWSRLFLSYDRSGNLNTEEAEFQYIRKNLRPYATFFSFLLLNIISYPFISNLWIPESEFAIIAFALTFTTLYSFHDNISKKLDWLLLLSFAVNVIGKYPYETDEVVRQTWRFLDIELPSLQGCFTSQIVSNSVEFCLNFRVIFYVLIPGMFLIIASRNNWRGTYKYLIPHCVTLSWWQVAVFFCKGATFYGLLRSTLALFGLVFFLPVVGIVTVFLPFVAVIKHLTDIVFTIKTAVIVILTFISLAIGYYKQRLNLGRNFFKVQIILSVISALILLTPHMTNFFESDFEMEEELSLAWDQYSTACQKTSWDKRSYAEIQHNCIDFNRMKINWEGRVDNVRITKVENNVLKVLYNIPQFLRSKLLCYYGEKYEKYCTETENEHQRLICEILNLTPPKDKCHVNSWNRYEFEISVKMNSDQWNIPEGIIHLIADDSFKNFTLKLQPKDRIWFIGSLDYPETLGSEMLMVSAEEIGCINCANKGLKSVRIKSNEVTIQDLVEVIYDGLKRVLNFICYPILNFP